MNKKENKVKSKKTLKKKDEDEWLEQKDDLESGDNPEERAKMINYESND